MGRGEELQLCDPMVDLSYEREGAGESSVNKWMENEWGGGNKNENSRICDGL